ncbi:right-handed parallel beta-helix repeat-containing protein [Algihabitans albus]|uniref:right-handed parallel beta-helix repeat-containing protein n=1 Tax=Algihabitans albus TaxID=2164067 RepID=UPI000E5D2F8A|nr:right-handed parallel beta-helix repeat-containing protein [Algihabitans albus]
MPRSTLLLLSVASLTLAATLPFGGAAWARDLQIDPSGTLTSGDETALVFPSLEAALAEAQLQGGERIFLHSGNYGDLTIQGQHLEPPVSLRPAPGAQAVADRLKIADSSGWHVSGLLIEPQRAIEPVVTTPDRGTPGFPTTLLQVAADARDIRLEDLTVRSAPSIADWGESEWIERAHHGVALEGARVHLLNSTIMHVRHAITVTGTGVRVEGNTIDRFSEDAVRALGDDGIYRGNTIKNCYSLYYHHDDGFQSWSRGPDGSPGTGVVRNVEITGNSIINFEDPDQPFRCNLQGIGLFDGMFENWTIANNLVVVDHFHGITVMGARQVKVLNNTVIDARPGQPGPPWVTVVAHKDGTAGSGNLVANNLSASFNEGGFDARDFRLDPEATLFTHNLRFDDARQIFRDPDRGDFRLRAGSAAIDAGTADFGTYGQAGAEPGPDLTVDLLGQPRAPDRAPDVGAYEFVQ